MGSGKILYVSDLDGTLLNSDQTLSEYTIDTINGLVEQGMIFSYATARSYITASKVTRGISPNIPVIVYNGTFILESGTRKVLWANFFDECQVKRVFTRLTENDVYPIVYAYINGVEKFSFDSEYVTKGMADFLESRKGDVRANPKSLSELCDGDVFYFTCIDSEEKLLSLYHLFKDEFQCVYSKDIYSGEQWLEIMPKNATKANAVLELKRILGCEKVICFGDGTNDLTMFSVCDEGYAVANAHDGLKQIATAVIGSNNDDGVAKWLADNYF